MVSDKNLRHAVIRGRQEKRLVKPDLQRPRRERAIPVGPLITESKMPLANDSGTVTSLLQERGQGRCTRTDDRGSIRRRNAGVLFSECIGAREKRIARRRAGRSRTVTP